MEWQREKGWKAKDGKLSAGIREEGRGKGEDAEQTDGEQLEQSVRSGATDDYQREWGVNRAKG